MAKFWWHANTAGGYGERRGEGGDVSKTKFEHGNDDFLRQHKANLEKQAMKNLHPLYFVRHIDGSFSPANPQPDDERIAAQAQYVYAQCDRQHALPVCDDPGCHLAPRTCEVLPSAMDFAAKRGIAITSEWARGWDECNAARKQTGLTV